MQKIEVCKKVECLFMFYIRYKSNIKHSVISHPAVTHFNFPTYMTELAGATAVPYIINLEMSDNLGNE